MTTTVRKHSSRASLNGGINSSTTINGGGGGGVGLTTSGPGSGTSSGLGLSDGSSNISFPPGPATTAADVMIKNNTNFIQIFRIILATIYLILIILTIPLAFELGGIDCGLSFTLTILVLYSILTTFRVYHFPNRIISSFLYYSQHLLLPSLLFLFISVFTSTTTLNTTKSNENSLLDTIWWDYIIKFWKFFLINATPMFTILEGFCSLLLIQSVGQTSKWLAKNKSETWSIVSLLSSGIIITLSIFFLFKIYVSQPPINLTNIGLISASLLGSLLTFTWVITAFGLISGKSTTIESSLIFSYIVKSIYEIFPELSQLNYSNFQELIKILADELYKIKIEGAKNTNINWFLINNESTTSSLLNKLSATLMLKYNNPNSWHKNLYNFVIKFITKNFPNSFQTLWDFLKLATINLTLPIIMNLFYRIGVFFAATKIIPILQPLSVASSTTSSPIASTASSPSQSPIRTSPSQSPKLSPSSNHAISKSSSNSSILSLKELQPTTTTTMTHNSISIPSSSSNSSSSNENDIPTSPILTKNGSGTTIVPMSHSGSVSSLRSNNRSQRSGSGTGSGSESATGTTGANVAAAVPSKTTRLIYLYSPCIIITVYTNLMIQYNDNYDDIPLINWLLKGYLDDGVHIWQFWHWVNVFLFLMLYTIELVLN